MSIGCMSLLAVLWLDIGADSDADALRLKSRWTEESPVGASVRYRLARGYADGSWVNGDYQTGADFAVELTPGKSAHFYRVDAEVTVNAKTEVFAGTNTIGLIWYPTAKDPEFQRIPLFFERPGVVPGQGLTIDLMLKCNRFSGGERFWLLDDLGRPRYIWQVDASGNFAQFPCYKITSKKCELKEYAENETSMLPGWMLKPEWPGAAAEGYWLCGQYHPLGRISTQLYTSDNAKAANSLNPENCLYFVVPYQEGLSLDFIVSLSAARIDYILPDGQTGTLNKARSEAWPTSTLPQLLNFGPKPVRGFPYGTIYRLIFLNSGGWEVGHARYGWIARPAYVVQPRICISTVGPDYYDDGELVRDGECYAVVKAPAGTERIEFTTGGKLVDPAHTLVAVLPAAKSGRLPETVLEFDSKLRAEVVNGDYFICLLDTRIDARNLAPRSGTMQVPTQVNACVVPAASEGGLPSFAVTTAANFAVYESPGIGLPPAPPTEGTKPQISSILVTPSNVLLTVEGMAPGADYFVVPAKTLDAFEAPLPDRPIGNVFNLRRQDEHRFFKIVGHFEVQ